MKKFIEYIVVCVSIRLPIETVVGLTDKQYRKREAKLEPLGDGFYKVLKHAGFKKGETLFLDPAMKLNPKQVAEIRPEIPEEETGSNDDVTVKPEGDILIKAIRDEIFNLDDEDYTADELPKVDALTSNLGYIVSGEDRNAGFAAYTEYVEQLRQSIEMIAADLDTDEIPLASVVAEFFKDETITQELVDAIYNTLKKGEENG
jgi:hypothetical protein